jgi:hypothetical protein
MSTPVLAPVRGTFRALAATIVPEAGSLDEGEWQELEAIVEDYLSRRPPGLRRQLRLFVRALGVLPIARWGRSFQTLDPARRTAFLAAVQDTPALLLRRGFWGVRTMVYLGYYSRAAAAAEIGYRANVAGWEARP